MVAGPRKSVETTKGGLLREATSRSRRPFGQAARLVCAVAMVQWAGPTAVARADALPRLHTNEQYVEELAQGSPLDIDDIMAVFEYVLGAMPPRARVYPTENYYYFHFHHDGVRYAGNLRLGPQSRARGEVDFIYFRSMAGPYIDESDHHATLGRDEGVDVEKVEDLVWRIGYRGRSVVLELNDLADARPPPASLGDDETYIGPVFDESGIRFFLVFDRKHKVFHYVLDETVEVRDELFRPEGLRHLLVGRRTAFAFATGSVGERKILIGVFAPNAHFNNYLDGPFDQLPDNFIQGDALQQALVLSRPELKGKIDRYGNLPDGESRELIAPYFEYYVPDDLAAADRCAAEAAAGQIYPCLHAIDME